MNSGSCTRKVPIRTAEAAEAVVEQMVRNGLPLARHYVCDYCGFWHVTSGTSKRAEHFANLAREQEEITMSKCNGWGISESQMADIEKNYGGRVVLKNDDGGPPSHAKIETWNKKRANVRIGYRCVRVLLSNLKPPADYRHEKPALIEPTKPTTPPATKKEPAPMPPEIAPRPATIIIPAQPAKAQPIPSPGPLPGSRIVVIAARMEEKAAAIAEKRAGFAAIEAEYQDAKRIRDAYAGEVEGLMREYNAAEQELQAATKALLGGCQ